ncbi:MAG: hypothetical protein WCD53_15970 [Microcoleus sp.]
MCGTETELDRLGDRPLKKLPVSMHPVDNNMNLYPVVVKLLHTFDTWRTGMTSENNLLAVTACTA